MCVSIKFIGYDIATGKKSTRVISNVVDRTITEEEICVTTDVLNQIDKFYLRSDTQVGNKIVLTKVKMICDDSTELDIYFQGVAYVTNDLGTTIDTIKG